MSIKESYNSWALQYDTNINRTRDLESVALRKVLKNISFDNCLEVGCGTGKNTVWLTDKAKHVSAIDLSEEMLKKAAEKVVSDKVKFKQFDITQPWTFVDKLYDMVSFSLVLEHINNLEHIFAEVNKLLRTGGYLYLGELHPFRQYIGSKARFDTDEGTKVVECYNHNISDFTQIAKTYKFSVLDLAEHFDDGDRNLLPRILTILFQKL